MSWGFRFHGGRVFRRYADKSESRTDWLARPLTERQCEYAAADVWYLLPITAAYGRNGGLWLAGLRRWMNAA